jgi:glycerophosphoryl diester phosphodiesterase
MSAALTQPWPYPRWIAHRGAGKLAPENTLAAFRLGASHGYRMFECDVKLSADGVLFLLHDDTLDRTSNGHGIAGLCDWRELSLLDAGAWHSGPYAGEPLASLEAIAAFCLKNDYDLNIEIKPTTGMDHFTGTEVARTAQTLWRDAPRPPLLSSFKTEALAAARAQAPELPRGLLLDVWRDDWLSVAQSLDCSAVIYRHTLWTAEAVNQAHAAGVRCLCYTANDDDAVQRLWSIGLDGIITDRVDHFSPTR